MVNAIRGGGRPPPPPTLTSQGPILPSSLNVRQKAAVATLCTLRHKQLQSIPEHCGGGAVGGDPYWRGRGLSQENERDSEEPEWGRLKGRRKMSYLICL
jgi:hypothetical protein